MDVFKKYASIETLENKKIVFKIFVLILLIYFILTFLFPTEYSNVIILIVFIAFIIYIYLQNLSDNTENINQQLMFKLNILQEISNTYINTKIDKMNHLDKKQINIMFNKSKLNSLYIDSNLIEFLYSIRKLSEWNLSEFYLLLKGTDNILQLRKELEEYYDANQRYPDNIYKMFEDSLFLRTKTVNNIHNFIYKIPKQNQMYMYINDIIKRYQILISRNTDTIYQYTLNHRALTGINTKTQFPIYNTIRPNDFREIDFYI